MNERYQREVKLFEAAFEQGSDAEREAFLDEACGDDAVLRARLKGLIEAARKATGFLEHPSGHGDQPFTDQPITAEPTVAEEPGDRIGRYRLLEKIGEGGCGVVYLAEQEEPLRREVALKIIKLGMDTRSVIARFEAERQALAMMDHPNIARVFDAGTIGDPKFKIQSPKSEIHGGRPYFVMELVRGIKITDYCNQNDLSIVERLELFIQICHAIQHAHQKGIIHRDIKPSNILVTSHSGVPVPKVIDFGIAKATEQRLTDMTLVTAFDQFIGTPAYMSPEQAEMSGLDIDTRTDIYALGVLLYELLTGKTPFDPKTLLAVGLDEMRRIICDQEPPRPSTRLHTLAAGELTTIAKYRSADPPKLISMLQGDLDWIVMKCLEKDRTRRYETANSLALDIQRHLDHEPVIARPPSTVYRMRKFARRNRLMVTAGAAVATALVLGVVVSSWLAIRATRAEVRAEAALHTMDFDAVNRLLASDGSADALALLARLLRQDPQDEVAAACLLNTLTTRSFCLPSMEPLLHDTKVSHARFSPDGAMVLTASGDHTVRLWDRLTGHLLVAPIPHRSEGLNPAVFSGPVHPVHALISPDGHWLATGSANNTARLWHRATGEPASPPLEHDDWVTCLAFRPNSGLLATGGKDGSVRLWQVSGGEPAGPVLRHRSWVNSVQFSPDGSMLATTSDDHTARVWQVPSGQPAGPPLTHQHGVREASFSPDGQRVVTASADYSARLWEVATGEPIGPPLNHDGVVVAASFSPDGTIVATASLDKTACLWTGLNTRPLVPPLRHEQEVRSVQFSPDGLRLVTGCADGTARIWEVMTGLEFTEPMRHQGTVWSARFSPDGRQVVTASADGTAQLWDVRPGQALGVSLTGNSRALFVQWSPDGERLLIVDAGIARVWDATTGATADYFGLGYQGGVLCARFSPDGQRLVTGSGHGDARVWCGWGEQALTPAMRHAGPIRWIEFSPDGQRVVTASDDHTARLWDSRTGQPIAVPCQHEDRLSVARFSPDGRMLLTASVDGTARLWDSTTGQPANLILRHEGGVVYAEFSPDGQRVVTASDDHTARVWHAGSGRNLGPALRHVAPVSSARFHPAGHRVVTTSEDGLARIWDWRTGRPVGNPLAHKAHVRWAEFSPDGRTVVTASTDGRAGLWDARTGFPRGPMLEHPRTLYFATFSPDGTAIVTGCLDRTARVWPILSVSGPAPDWLPDLAEAVAGRRLTQDRTSEVVPVTRYLDLKTRLAQSQGQDPYSNWGRWFVADRSTRATAPGGRRSVREFANDLIAPWDVYYLQRSNRITQALMLDPTNGLAYARYGFALSHLPISPRLEAKFGWLSQQADRWAGQTSDACLLRARLAQLRGSDEEALALLEAGLASAQDNGLAWVYHAGLLRISGRLEESFASLARAEKVAIQTWPASQRLLRWTRLFNLERHPGFEQAFAAKVVEEWRDRFWRIPPRPPDTPGRCLDLTGFYSISSGHGWNLDRGPPLNLSALPPTWFLLDETPFDVRGVIPLGSRTLAAAGWPWPTEVRGIPVRQTCQRLHFLHATDRAETSGVVVARYRVHFADGQALEILLRYGHDLGSWLTTPDSEPLPLEPAWRIRGVERHHQLYHTAWDNPRPTVAIESLDLISTMSDAAPFVLAITMDPFPATFDPSAHSRTMPAP